MERKEETTFTCMIKVILCETLHCMLWPSNEYYPSENDLYDVAWRFY